MLQRGEDILEERFTIVVPFRKHMSVAYSAAIIDQFKELFGVCKLGVHITPSELRRTLTNMDHLGVGSSQMTLEQSASADLSSCSTSSVVTESTSTSSVEWVVPSTSSFAVIARKPLPEGHTDIDVAEFLKENAVISRDMCRQLCTLTCFRWLIGNAMKKISDGKMFVRRVSGEPLFASSNESSSMELSSQATTALNDEVHLHVFESQDALFDESCPWESFSGSFSYRIFVLDGRAKTGTSVLSLHEKCSLHSRRLEYMTRLLETINVTGTKWNMSRLLFEWRKRLEAVCRSIHPSTLWIGNFVMRRITQHLQSVDYGAELEGEEDCDD